MGGPLAGVRVLDLSRVVAGPLATRILADQGAEVIKVEPPEGDMTRTFPPYAEEGLNPYFAQQNAGKRFCSVDLGAPGAPELVAELAAVSDVLVENFRPGVLARYGLGPAELCARHPKLVYCSITGFGQDGPWAARRAYAPIGHLESGLLHYDQRKIGRPAHQPPMVLGDVTTALNAVGNINALLTQAARTGRGGHVDVCMVETMVYIQEWVSTELAGGWDATNAGSCHENPILRLPDGRVWGIGGNPVAWFDTLVESMGMPELRADPRFVDIETREAHKAELLEILVTWAASFERFDDFRLALEARSPFTAAELRSITELAASDFAAHRQLFATTDPGPGHRIPARPASGAGIGTTGRLAPQGADNRAVLRDVLGYDDARIDALTAAGVLTASSPSQASPWR